MIDTKEIEIEKNGAIQIKNINDINRIIGQYIFLNFDILMCFS